MQSQLQNYVFNSVTLDLNDKEKYFQEINLVLLLYIYIHNYYLFSLKLLNFIETLFWKLNLHFRNKYHQTTKSFNELTAIFPSSARDNERVNVFMCLCMYDFVSPSARLWIGKSAGTHTDTQTHRHTHTYVCIYIYIYTHTYTRTYTYIHIYIYIYIYTQARKHAHTHIHACAVYVLILGRNFITLTCFNL